MNVVAVNTGRAMLIVERDSDDLHRRLQLETLLWTCNDRDEPIRACVQEDLRAGLNEADLEKIRAVRELELYERVRLAVRYRVEYTQDYWGEYDCSAGIELVRVMRRHRAPRRYFGKGR